ncbi:MAG: hypothetical protein WDO14_04220 [Bacteroidota bacterium]
MKRTLLLLCVLSCALPALAQIPTDGLLMPAKTLCTGFMYQHDSWDNYWEGSLKRVNGNVGTWTGQTTMWYGVYGVTPKLNVMASVPFVANKVSGGTMMPMNGLQDLMISGKYKLIETAAGPGKFYVFGVASFSTPLSSYTPDFYPISLGTHTTNVGGRLTFNYTSNIGIYLNTSGGYTWRSNTKLDRPAYYTDGHYYSTDEVWMPNTLDYNVDLGYHKGPLQVTASYMQMNTLGGGDIRRQDMPFVSNKMNASRISGLVMYYLPWPKNLAVRAQVIQTVAGRNVGQTTSYMGGLLYTIYFNKTTTDETSK